MTKPSQVYSNHSNNDSKDSSPTPTTNDNNVTPVSNGSSLTPTSNDSMDLTPTLPAAVIERRKYKKRGGTGFIRMKGTMKAKYMYHATIKPCQAKTNAVATISALLANTSCTQNVVKLVIEDVWKLIHLYYIKIGAPLPEDWHGKCGTIWRTIAALEMTANKHRKVETVIHSTYHSLRNGKIFNESRSLRQNEMAIANGSKIQQLVVDCRETGLSYSETMMVINIYCIENNIPTFTCSAIVLREKRMVKEILPIIK